MQAKRIPEPIDGAPFIAGCVTLLRQFHSDNTHHCLLLLGQYTRSIVETQITTRLYYSTIIINNILCSTEQVLYGIIHCISNIIIVMTYE